MSTARIVDWIDSKKWENVNIDTEFPGQFLFFVSGFASSRLYGTNELPNTLLLYGHSIENIILSSKILVDSHKMNKWH